MASKYWRAVTQDGQAHEIQMCRTFSNFNGSMVEGFDVVTPDAEYRGICGIPVGQHPRSLPEPWQSVSNERRAVDACAWCMHWDVREVCEPGELTKREIADRTFGAFLVRFLRAFAVVTSEMTWDALKARVGTFPFVRTWLDAAKEEQTRDDT